MKNLIIIISTFLTSTLFGQTIESPKNSNVDSLTIKVEKTQTNLVMAGESLMNVSRFQVIMIAATPLYFVTPVIAGIVQIVCVVGTISETHKAGKIMSEINNK
jgi:hypothetical protein